MRIIIQARTDSSRLPGKALLPVAGVPSAILAALRAANRGHPIVLATSDRTIDDLLAKTATAAGIQVFRGSSNDVRSRFLAAAVDMSDGDIVVRLTADNMVPDGDLVEQLLVHFHDSNTDYLSADLVWQSPPYGLGVEIMRLGALRAVASIVDTPYDREHVTPALCAEYAKNAYPKPFFSARESCLRCTMDTFEDYCLITQVFEGVQAPIQIGWRELLGRLAGLPEVPPALAPGPGLVLGTAQLAAPYGSVLRVTPPGADEGVRLVRRAITCGAIAIDTARAYTGSEKVVGQALEGGWENRVLVVTKLSPLPQLKDDTSPASAAAAAEISVLRSLHTLGRKVKPLLMLHRANHLTDWDGAVWRQLLELRNEGLISGLGVSVQTPDEARAAIAYPDVQVIQLPLNVLDWRWTDAGLPEWITAPTDLQIHVRSVFLQGILLRPPVAWPCIAGIDPSAILGRLAEVANKLERASVADLCVAWVRAQPWVNGVVLGMERLTQLEDNLALFSRPPLTMDEAAHVQKALPRLPESLLNPAHWPAITLLE